MQAALQWIVGSYQVLYISSLAHDFYSTCLIQPPLPFQTFLLHRNSDSYSIVCTAERSTWKHTLLQSLNHPEPYALKSVPVHRRKPVQKFEFVRPPLSTTSYSTPKFYWSVSMAASPQTCRWNLLYTRKLFHGSEGAFNHQKQNKF